MTSLCLSTLLIISILLHHSSTLNSSSILPNLISCVHATGDFLNTLPLSRRSQGYWTGEQFKSQADLDSHTRLSSSLAQLFPSTPILSEESDFRCFDSDEYFVIDPIDGTRSYVEGYAGWVVQAALVRDGSPFCSVIYAPSLNLTYYAEFGAGAFLNDTRISLDLAKPITSIVDNYPRPRGLASYLYNYLSLDEYIESGSISLKMCLVASGAADLFVKDMSPRDWDIIPPLLLFSELGLFLSDLEFKPFILNKPSLSHRGIIACRSLCQASTLRAPVMSYLVK